MKFLHIWTTSLLLTAASVNASTDFLSLVPDDALLVFSITDGSSFTPRWESSPIGKAFADIDFSGFIASLPETEADADEDDLTSEELEIFLERMQSLQSELPGASCFYYGSLAKGLSTVAKNKKLRAEIIGSDDDSEEEEDLTDEQERQLLRLDRSDMNAFLGQLRFLADVEGDGAALIEKMSDWAQEDMENLSSDEEVYTFEEIEIDDVPVYREQSFYLEEDGTRLPSDMPDFYWAVSDSVLAITFTEQAMRDQIAKLRDMDVASIDENEQIREALAYTDRGDLTMIFNFPVSHDIVKSLLPDTQDQEAANPMIPAPDKILDWVGLKSLRPYVFSMSLADDGIEGKTHLGFTARTILADLLMQQHDADHPRPDFIHRDFMNVSAGHYRVADFYESLESQLGSISPQAAAGLGMVRMMGAGQLGLDFKAQLLDHFDSRFILVQHIDTEKFKASLEKTVNAGKNGKAPDQTNGLTPGQSFLFASGVKNKTDLESSLKTLAGKVSQGAEPETELYNGHEIFIPAKSIAKAKGVDPGDLVSYAWLDDYLLVSIGNGDLIKKAIDASKDADLQLWNTSEFASAWDRIGGEANYIEYSNQKQAMGMLSASLEPLRLLIQEEGISNLPDLSSLASLFSSSLGVVRTKDLVAEIESITLYDEKHLQ